MAPHVTCVVGYARLLDDSTTDPVTVGRAATDMCLPLYNALSFQAHKLLPDTDGGSFLYKRMIQGFNDDAPENVVPVILNWRKTMRGADYRALSIVPASLESYSDCLRQNEASAQGDGERAYGFALIVDKMCDEKFATVAASVKADQRLAHVSADQLDSYLGSLRWAALLDSCLRMLQA